jgi:phosphate transport system permease protein
MPPGRDQLMQEMRDNAQAGNPPPRGSEPPVRGGFGVAPSILRTDALMRRLIPLGGLGILLLIGGLFLFILAQILPLFQGARVGPAAALPGGTAQPLLIAIDEWGERPMIADAQGALTFYDRSGARPVRTLHAPLPPGAAIRSTAYLQAEQMLLFGLDDGRYLSGRIRYAPEFDAQEQRSVTVDVVWDPVRALVARPGALADIDAFVSDTRMTFAAVVERPGGATVEAASFTRRRSLFGEADFVPEERFQLPLPAGARPLQVRVGSNAESIVVRGADGAVHYFLLEGGQWSLRQRFTPFADTNETITSMEFLNGRVSLSFTGTRGSHHVYSLYRSDNSGPREFGRTRAFPVLPGAVGAFAASIRNKAMLLGAPGRLSLRYGTTGEVRWESAVDFTPVRVLIGGKYDRLLALDETATLHVFPLRDPHPEAGLRAFFTPIWYEGRDGPRHIWQSTGGSDDFEPKFSLIPLIVGSLKGTFYALLFAIPIALLAAVYTSQFLSPQLRRFIKPGIEVMASLPSVVLGFLAALWLAPILEDRVPSVILVLFAVPLAAILAGVLWPRLPLPVRHLVPGGWEFALLLPLVGLAATLAWQLGPAFEAVAFRFTDPASGQSYGDFRLWWETLSGSQFQQRNALVVGFMMGFAVIPIIYTLAEDALSSVPASLVSGSLALGANRWQTTARIVLPTAAPGIFSAIMIGLGRAVGETMIVVMATGNTPIMDFDLFSGMRTLSANIAVELPEAPHGGTLYRTLFLGAFVLFILTFVINTAAEFLRARLRARAGR